jgi:two-component system chemotaxis sensor kinase CheA
MPISDVLSFHKAEEDQVTVTKKGQEVLNLRGELIPILKLYEVHRIETERRSVAEGIVVVILADNKKAALLVDEILDYKQLVVKPLPDSMGVMRGVSGCSIMGDGNVSLIIDTPSLVGSVLE